MKKTHIFPCQLCCVIVAALIASSCSGDADQYSLDYFYNRYVNTDTAEVVVLPDTIALSIDWSGAEATITGDYGDSIAITRGTLPSDIIITSTSQRFLSLTLSGTSDDGSLLVYSDHLWGLTLNGLTLTNADGPAINNQCGRWLYVTLADSTVNTLTDGATYAAAPVNAAGNPIDQKGTFFSEGQVLFSGAGSLTVNGNAMNGIASDDYIIMESGSISVSVASTGTNGIKVNDGMEIMGGQLDITVLANGARGIKNDSYMNISGGITTIKTTGDCLVEDIEGVKDTTSCAGIKCDSLFTMTAGELTISSSGDGGKGINAADSVKMQGGTLTIATTGSNDIGKPKGIKSTKAIVASGGSMSINVKKSWALDNGLDTEDPMLRLTIEGQPATTIVKKREVKVVF